MPKKTLKAIEALEEAQKIAFAPFVFQTTVTMKKLGVFDLIFENRKRGGISLEDIANELSLSIYGMGVLLEFAESSDIVNINSNNKFELTKTGYFLNFNKTVDVNINFTQDVCYKGLFHLEESIKTGRPEGLRELGNWNTIYEGLTQLDPIPQKSWFDFDHHYSDDVFHEALNFIFKSNPKHIFDIGGNTGKFAISSCKYNSDVMIKIIDLPRQLQRAFVNVRNEGFEKRVSAYEIDWLSENPKIPKGADSIWMSQFLDCFSEDQILKILKTCVESMNDQTELMIMETFTDRQKFDNAKFILEATSLYFTVMANGNSKMYSSKVIMKIANEAGLMMKEDLRIGEYHTILVYKKR